MEQDTQGKETALLEKISNSMERSGVSHGVFLAGIKMVLTHVNKKLAASDKNVGNVVDSIKEIGNDIKVHASGIIKAQKEEMQKSHMKVIANLDKEVSSRLKKLETLKGDPGAPGKSVDHNEVVKDVLAKIPPRDPMLDDPMDIRDRLASLPEGDRLHINMLDGFEEMRQEMENRYQRSYGDVIASRAGRVQQYDLSSKLDGVTKTFSLPAFWTVISVSLSSAPNILRPTIDYTVSQSTMQITFTSQIIAAAQLATGQTCIVVYQEP